MQVTLIEPEEPTGTHRDIDAIQSDLDADQALVDEYLQLKGYLAKAPREPEAPEPCQVQDTAADLKAHQDNRDTILRSIQNLERKRDQLEPEEWAAADLDGIESQHDKRDLWEQKLKLLAQGHICCPECGHEWPVADLGELADVELTERPEMTRREITAHRARIGNSDEIAKLDAEIAKLEVPEDRSADLSSRQTYDQQLAVAVRMLDNVVDVSNFPLPQQEAEAKAKRRIGLGVTGVADALAMVGVRYGSDKAAEVLDDWMHHLSRAAYIASVELAEEKGAFPLFEAEKFLASGNMLQMDADVRTLVGKYGIRNSHLTSIAPTGTISLYAGNVSSGIEPVFAYSYTRKVLQPDGSRTEETVEDYEATLWRNSASVR